MATIPDLRVIDPLRPGISADTVALPDIIEALKAFNEQWGLFEKDLDPARLKEVIAICKSMEMLARSLGARAAAVRTSIRAEKFELLEGKLKKAMDRRAELMMHTLKEETLLYGDVRLADTNQWINARIEKLKKQIQNRKNWANRKAANPVNA